jgi:hypothetical protein
MLDRLSCAIRVATILYRSVNSLVAGRGLPVLASDGYNRSQQQIRHGR